MAKPAFVGTSGGRTPASMPNAKAQAGKTKAAANKAAAAAKRAAAKPAKSTKPATAKKTPKRRSV